MFVCNVCKTFKNLDINFTDFLLQLSWVRRLVKALPHNIFKASAAQAKCRCLLFKIKCFSALRVGWPIRLEIKYSPSNLWHFDGYFDWIQKKVFSLIISNIFWTKNTANFKIFVKIWIFENSSFNSIFLRRERYGKF